ncbi:MAG: PASTA domain-containing protein [Deltaproteobacteria bacterium]|nr:MAG: PASTA domain-containing protein [Deltaproteobacteria bacterium]
MKKTRIIVIGLFFLLCHLVILSRTFQLQVLSSETLRARAERQQRKTIALTPRRGRIFDREGQELAASVGVDSIYAQPQKILTRQAVARQLSPVLRISRKELLKRFSSERQFVWLSRRISPSQSQRIKALELNGIGFIRENKRFYPNRTLAGHLLGFAGLDSQGLEGLELKYDYLIKGESEIFVAERDARGYIISPQGGSSLRFFEGNDLYLTIHKGIQHVAEKELKKAVLETKAKSGTVIVTNPHTGEVLAMALQPEFNPNCFWRYQPSTWRNRAITDSFEPGSTFKAFLLAAAIEESIVRPDDLFYCEQGSLEIGDNIIRDPKEYGWLTLKQIIHFSSNIGAGKIGEKLGKEKFYRYITAFGFGEKTGIDLPGEISGLVRPLRSWYQMTLRTVSFGQGISLTPIQLINALGAIANGGQLMRPFVVKKVVDPRGEIIRTTQPSVMRRVISPGTARTATRILTGVTKENGTGWRAALEGYEVAGKTGTAQKADIINGGYSEDRLIGSFMGFVPAEDPKLAILVIIDEPQENANGGLVAAPVFRRVAEKALLIMGTPPTQFVSVPSSTQFKTKPGVTEPPPPLKIPRTSSSDEVQLPNLTGLSLRQALLAGQATGLKLRISGSGQAVEQRPTPGTAMSRGEECWIKLRPRSL